MDLPACLQAQEHSPGLLQPLKIMVIQETKNQRVIAIMKSLILASPPRLGYHPYETANILPLAC